MAEFIDFQADVDTINSENEEVNDDIDEVTLLNADNDSLFCYNLHNVSGNPEEAIDNFLINKMNLYLLLMEYQIIAKNLLQMMMPIKLMEDSSFYAIC